MLPEVHSFVDGNIQETLQKKNRQEVKKIEPIYLKDNSPEVLFWYPSLFSFALAALALPHQLDLSAISLFSQFKEYQWFKNLDTNGIVSEGSLFWLWITSWIVFFVLYRGNLSRKNFLLVVGILGTVIGIPASLEIVGFGVFFQWLAKTLGDLHPSMNAGAYSVIGILALIPWIWNFAWSNANNRAKLDESNLTIWRADGTSEQFDLVGLVTRENNFDYGERLVGGYGSLILLTKAGKELFRLQRVKGLYWTPLFFWRKGLSGRINYLLSFQGKVASVNISGSDESSSSDEDHGVDNAIV